MVPFDPFLTSNNKLPRRDGPTDEQRAELERIVRARSTPQAVARRARMLRRCFDGYPLRSVARLFATNSGTVAKWRARYARSGVPGLFDERRSGRPSRVDKQALVMALIRARAKQYPGTRTLSTRKFAAAYGISPSSALRIFRLVPADPVRDIRTYESSRSFV